MSDFQQEWVFSKEDQRIRELAEKYHTDCEAFDRTICTGPVVNGSVTPIGPRELAAVNMNASMVLREILTQAESEGLSRCDMKRAIGRYA